MEDEIYTCPKCKSEDVSINAYVLIDVNEREILDDISEIAANAIDMNEEAQCDECGHTFNLGEKTSTEDED